jgi:hypothetical protein
MEPESEFQVGVGVGIIISAIGMIAGYGLADRMGISPLLGAPMLAVVTNLAFLLIFWLQEKGPKTEETRSFFTGQWWGSWGLPLIFIIPINVMGAKETGGSVQMAVMMSTVSWLMGWAISIVFSRKLASLKAITVCYLIGSIGGIALMVYHYFF